MMKLKVLSVLALALLTACQQNSTDAPLASELAPSTRVASNAAFAISGNINLDCSYNTDVVANGASVISYQNSSVAANEVCVSETRTCSNGLLSGSYNFSGCNVASAASCLFNGETILDGASATAFLSTTVELGQECINELRTCNNGVMTGSYQYSSCNINLNSGCIFNGQTINHGASVSAYLNSSVGTNEQCVVETRYCVNGALSGANQYASCTVDAPASCLFNGQTISHGQNVTAYLNSSVDVGAPCSNEVRTCNNGVLSGSNSFASCNVNAPASCLFDGKTIPSGADVTAFLTSTTQFGLLCSSEKRTCNNGALSGSYTFANCSIDAAASCLFNGQTIADGAAVTAFISSSVSAGGTCASENRICSNGVLSGSYAYANCTAAPNCSSCLFNGVQIQNGQSVIAYQLQTVDDNKKCVAQVRVCNNSVLSGNYSFSSCSVKDEDDKDDDDRVCKKDRVHKEDEDKDDDDSKHKEHNKSESDSKKKSCKPKHKEHFDCGKHLGWYKEKRKNKNK